MGFLSYLGVIIAVVIIFLIVEELTRAIIKHGKAARKYISNRRMSSKTPRDAQLIVSDEIGERL